MTVEIRVKRVYQSPASADGHRVPVERLWPRGVRKDVLKLDLWARNLGASEADYMPRIRSW